MLIRPLQAADIANLAQLMATTPLWQRYGVSETSAAARLQQGLDQGATILVAEVPDPPGSAQVAGFIWYAAHGAFQRGGYIMLIGVQPALRGQGFGEALLHQAESAMFAQVESIFLLVSDFNGAAQRFYARLGYQQIGAIPAFVLPDITELIFYKRKT